MSPSSLLVREFETLTLTLTLTLTPIVTLPRSAYALPQVVHGLVLETPPTCLSAFRNLVEASILLLESSHSTAILAALPASLLSLEVKSDADHFAVWHKGAGCA